MFLRRIAKSTAILALAVASLTPSVASDQKDSSCAKPPEFVAGYKPTKEEQAKARKVRPQGMVAISISEDGDVVEAKVVRASSPEAVDLLLARAKSMKYKARPGCGIYKATVNYTLAGQ